MIKTGMLINDRYEIIEKIGTGGMSEVYKAKCIKLNRFVAIKILKDEYCLDDAFVRRFKAEAQSAASLSHANIVNIYDVGNENRIHFIVMEYLEGKTLKQVIKEAGIIQDKEALNIALSIASALEHAHSNHIIHRDIKPQNIIATNDGKIKVADFGIARIASEKTITVTDETTGSVHYIAPEQARGGYCDEKSDIYSLGITLFEMVTGELPYKAESAVSVALKHIQDKFPVPSELNPDINKSLEQIILKCTQKKPEVRYQSAAELIADLKKALDFPSEEFVKINQFEDDSPTMIISSSEFEGLRKAIDAQDKNESVAEDIPETEKRPIPRYKKENNEDKKKSRMVMALGVFSAFLLVAIIFGVSYAIWNMGHPGEAKEIEIPNVIGKSFEDAKKTLENAGIDWKEGEYQFSTEQDKDYIINQSIKGKIEEKLIKDTVVELTISKGKDAKKVPDIVDMTFDEAEKIIRDSGFKANRVMEYNDKVDLGVVIKQQPEADELLAKGEEITIFVSQGKEKAMVTMPDVTLISEEQGITLIKSKNLKIGNISYTSNDVVKKGQIISSSIPSGTEVEEGSAVNLVVSKGAATVRKQVIINDLMPNELSSGLLEVYLTLPNQKGTLVYADNVQKSDFPVYVNVDGTGKGVVDVYFNGSKEFSNTIIFSEEGN